MTLPKFVLLLSRLLLPNNPLPLKANVFVAVNSPSSNDVSFVPLLIEVPLFDHVCVKDEKSLIFVVS